MPSTGFVFVLLKIHVQGMLSTLEGTVADIAPTTAEIPPGVMDKEQYAGLRALRFYSVDIDVPNTGSDLKIGMTGEAKVILERRSVAARLAEMVTDFAARKVW